MSISSNLNTPWRRLAFVLFVLSSAVAVGLSGGLAYQAIELAKDEYSALLRVEDALRRRAQNSAPDTPPKAEMADNENAALIPGAQIEPENIYSVFMRRNELEKSLGPADFDAAVERLLMERADRHAAKLDFISPPQSRLWFAGPIMKAAVPSLSDDDIFILGTPYVLAAFFFMLSLGFGLTRRAYAGSIGRLVNWVLMRGR